ncbi:MAG: type II toxin-antitoxin system prevent-host-death family antitoxin [Polyangiaceae bacterium]|nr:type II toxin-antitoxin system prevent-host-death family antitoxin [Polyangiaceae bacterium]
MGEVNIHEAKTHLSRLITRVLGGEAIVIARAGVPVAMLVPMAAPSQREIGFDDGSFELPDDFDAPLSPEVLALFEGAAGPTAPRPKRPAQRRVRGTTK